MKKNNLLLLLSFILTGCGFSSGLYKDIIQAQDLITEQKYKEAALVYETILLKKPSKNINIKINFQLGEIYSIYLNDYNKSLKYFISIAENSNEPAWQIKSLEKMGSIYFDNLKDYKQSIKVYEKLINVSPALQNQNYYKLRYAISYLKLNKLNESIKKFKDLLKTNESEIVLESYFNIGIAYFYQKKWNNAVKNWYEFLRYEKRKDKIVQVKFLIANAYESNEELKKAYNIYYSILGEYPNTSVIKNRLNSLYERRVSRKR